MKQCKALQNSYLFFITQWGRKQVSSLKAALKCHTPGPRFSRRKKRPLMLLEVLIAFALVTMCAVPLIYPHIYIYRVQREFINKIEVDHRINLLYAEILEQLYRNEIPLDIILNNREQKIDEKWLADLGYSGTYQFEKTRYEKTSKNEDWSVYVIALNFNVKRIRDDKAGTTYHYEFALSKEAPSV